MGGAYGFVLDKQASGHATHMSDAQLTAMLHDEFRSLRRHLGDMTANIARLEERVEATRGVQERINLINTDVVRLGADTKAIKDIKDKVEANTKKLDSLDRSRAALIGYAVASGAAVASVFKLFM